MERASLTVVTESGAQYGADNIQAVSRDGEPHIAFVCSGEMTEIPAEEVRTVNVSAEERTCMHCTR